MFILLCFFSFLSSFIAVSGGNGLIMLPILMGLGFKLSYIIPLLRVTAVVFIITAMISAKMAKKPLKPEKDDYPMIILIAISSIIAATFIHYFSEEFLEIITFTIVCFFLIAKLNTKLFTMIASNKILQGIICIFAGMCAALFGGAGVLITIILLSKGVEATALLSRRLVASLIAQASALSVFIFHGHIKIDENFFAVTIFSAIGIFISTTLSYKIKGRFTPYLLYISIFVSLIMLGYKILNP